MDVNAAKRAARFAAIGLGAVIALVLVAVALMLVPAVREVVLREALRRADTALPGSLRVGRAAWPAPGQLELESVLWTAEHDTLLAVRGIALRCRLGELRRGDLHLDSLVVDRLRVDWPALRRALPAEPSSPPPSAPPAPARFPRPGSLPPVPSIAVDELRIDAPSLTVSAEHAPARVSLAGSVELRRERTPHVALREVQVEHPGAGLTVGPGSLALDLERGVFRGDLPGQWRADWPFRLTAGSGQGDRFHLELELPGEAQLRARVRVDGTRRRDEDGAPGAEVRLAAELPPVGRLAGIPELADALAPLPAGERLVLDAEGTIVFGRSPRSRFRVRTGPFAALDSLVAEVRTGEGGTEVSGLELRAAGLELLGSWSLRERRHAADLEARIEGTGWVEPFAPELSLPELSLAVATHLSGPAEGLRGESTLRGRLALDGTRIDSVDVALRGAHTGEGWLDWQAAVRSSELWLTGDGRLRRGETIEIETSPFAVELTRADPGGRRTGRVSVAADGSRVTAKDVRVDGVFGELRLDGNWERAGGGRATADLLWPSLPAALAQRLDAPADSIASAAERWRDAGELGVRIEATMSPAGTWRADSDLRLPGPAALAPVIAADADLSSLTPVAARLTAWGSGEGVDVRLDAGATPWLDAARAELRMRGERAVLDTLQLEAFDVRLSAAGFREGDRVEASARLDLDRLDGLRRLLPALPADLELAAAADAQITGALAAPDVGIELGAQAASPALELPGAHARIEFSRGTLARARIAGTDTLRTGSVVLGRWALEVRPLDTGEAPFPLLASVELEGPDLAWTQVASVERGRGWTVQTDTLAARLGTRDLRSRRPFAVRWSPVDSTLTVDDLELDGTLGSVRAEGAVDPEATDLRIILELDGLPPIAASGIPPGLRPDRIRATLHVARRDSLRLEASAGGMALGSRRNLEAFVTADAGAGGTAATFSVSSEQDELARGEARIPRALDACALSLADTGGSWAMTATVDGLPLPERMDPAALRSWSAGTDEERNPRLAGSVEIAGTMERPVARADAAVTFPRWRQLGSHRVNVEAELDSTGVRSRLVWNRNETAIATADVWLAAAPDSVWAMGDSLSAHLVVTDWKLEEVDALAPPTVRAGGRVRCDLRAEGRPRAARLDGWLEARAISVSTARGDRARAEGRLEIAGTTAAPEAEGELVIRQGRLLIPEPPRELHDARGEAILWEEWTPPDNDTGADDGATAAETNGPTALDLGIDLTVPGAFWIRGRGLDVEMAGDLNLVLSGGELRVDGELRAVGGHLSLFGNRFVVERGAAVFYGTEAIDPDLDIRLAQQKGDVRVLVHVTGPASSPALALSSEPPMEEADILSHLFFGRSNEDLDREQSGFLQSQAAAALRMFAIPGLERALGWRLGLDVVRLGTRDDPAQSLSLVVGKYLSPRVLLTYDQGLEDATDSAVNLEYWITRHVRLETRSSRSTQSAIQMNWTKDY